MAPGQHGGTLVIFLHGYGGRGARYLPLAQELGGSHVRVCLPESPVPHRNGTGRIWWEFLKRDWPQYFADDPAWDARSQPSRQLAAASGAVANLIARLRARHRPDRLVVAGHSQGAMLALHVAVAREVQADAVGMVAGALLADTVRNVAGTNGPRPFVVLVHGRNDETVAFGEAERANRVLTRLGFAVELRIHDEGHALPQSTRRDLEEPVARVSRP